MTWILGSGVTWGYGALIADVRVVWPGTARRIDALQKIYPVGHWMMAGFAGSVEIGFCMIESMQTAFSSGGADGLWKPQIAAWRWHRHARRIFQKARPELQQHGSSILLVGVSPLRNGPFHWTRCVRMRSPHFIPERCAFDSWLSIGTGATHELALEFSRLEGERSFHIQRMELQNRGGSAAGLAGIVARRLHDSPLATVSEQLLVGTVWPGRFDIQMLDGRFHGGGWSTWQRVAPVGIASSWPEFERLARDVGLPPSAAAT